MLSLAALIYKQESNVIKGEGYNFLNINQVIATISIVQYMYILFDDVSDLIFLIPSVINSYSFLQFIFRINTDLKVEGIGSVLSAGIFVS